MPSLTLSAQSISVEIRVFGSANYPRERLNPGGISFSRWGAPLLSGQSFEPKHVWNIDGILREPELLLLQDLHGLYQIEPFAITIKDTITPYTEPTPRSRPIADGTATTIGSRVRYFAEFDAGFNSALEVTKINDRYQATFQLLELGKRGI